VLIPHDSVFQKTLSNLKEVESRGGRIIVVTDTRTDDLEDVAWEVLTVPRTNELLTPILLTIPLQLLAYHVAVYRGTDVDQPRNLAKGVTVEWADGPRGARSPRRAPGRGRRCAPPRGSAGWWRRRAPRARSRGSAGRRPTARVSGRSCGPRPPRGGRSPARGARRSRRARRR